jgi:hypothetical protein
MQWCLITDTACPIIIIIIIITITITMMQVHNEELHNLYCLLNSARVITLMKWTEHIV